MKKDIESRILTALKKAIIGLTTSDLAEKLGVSRLTIMRYLQMLKGRGVIVDKQVGAYKLWMLKENVEKRRKLISRKLACVLAGVFLRLFGEETEEIAFNVGKELAKQFIKKHPEDYELLKEVSEDAFTKIATALEFIGEELNAEGFSLDENRGIVRIKGPFCDDDDVSNILITLISGAVVGFLEYELNKKVILVNKKVDKKKEETFEVILEVMSKES